MNNGYVPNQESVMNNPPNLLPVDPNFYTPMPVLPINGMLPVNGPYLPAMVPMSSNGSMTSLASSPGLVASDSGLQKLGSASSLQSVSPNNMSMNAMSFTTSSPLLTQPATSPYNLVAPQQVNYFVPNVSPRFTTPSVSPQPPMVDQTQLYISPSPLLLTPQQSTSSVNSESATPELPNMFLNGNTFTLIPPTTSFTSSRTPERYIPTHISPARSPQMPERTTTQTGFRERPMSQMNSTHRAGYPPNKPTTSFQNEVMPSEGPVAGKRQKKFGYRSKQRKIDRTHRNIQEKFSALGLFAKERELVRGDDTLRIHVKTFEGLTDIQTALTEIHNHKEIEICRVAAVFSKKNRFQKKGFIVYLKVGSVAEVDSCQRLLKRFGSLRNVAIARAKTSVKEPTSELRTNKPVQISKTFEDFIPEVHIPRRLSATAM